MYNNAKSKAPATKAEWLKRNGFSEDGVTFVITGGNTYDIKEALKANGCVFNKILGWHCPTQFDLSEFEGFTFVPFAFDDLFVWNPNLAIAVDLNPGQTDKRVKEALAPYQPKKDVELASGITDSEFMGAIGDRLRKIPAKLVGRKEFQGPYGPSVLYTFESGKSVLCWFTSSFKDIEVGDNILLSGTVKDQKNYNGQNQTYLTRCLFYDIE